MELGTSAVTLVSNSPEEKNERSKKIFLIVSGVLIVAVAFIIATALLADTVLRSNKQLVSVREELRESKQGKLSNQEEEKVCWTKECILSAAELMESMDETVDPCQDFHKFACGGWKKTNVIPTGYRGISTFSILDGRIDQFVETFFKENSTSYDSKPINNTRDMYKACVDTDSIEETGITPLIEILNSYGQWPMTVSNWTEDRFDWRKATASIRNTFGMSFLFEVSNFVDVQNTDISTIYLDQPTLGLSSSLLTGNNLTSYSMAVYSTFVSKVAFVIRDSIAGGVSNETVIKETEDMIRFHIELANILMSDKERQSENSTQFYNPLSVAELQALTDEVNRTSSLSQIDWHEHLNDIYSIANVSIDQTEQIIVTEPDYLKRLVELLDQTSPKVIANFIHWRLVLEHLRHLNGELNMLMNEFSIAVYGPSRAQTREKWCENQVNEIMGFAIGSRFIEETFDTQAKIEVQEMIRHLKVAFSSLVEESDWMDQETKINALEKAAEIKEYVGYPDWIANRTTLELAYRGIETKPNSHFANFQSVKRFMIATNLRFLRFRTDRENLWISFPSVVNAFYFAMLNSITFPAGIMQPPFYGRGRLAASNYGGIGMIIGHEITHGFDHQGHKWDKKGHKKTWWTNSTLDKFYKRKQCIVDQYGNFSIHELLNEGINLQINGSRTQGENIADNGGMREAFRAYQNYVAKNGREPRLPGLERYTPEQIFFMSFGNIWCNNVTPKHLAYQIKYGVHSPARYRVLGTLSNSDDFSRHFNCPVGSPMNRKNKCTVW